MLLSILIPTLKTRVPLYARLAKCLAPQLSRFDPIELLDYVDDGEACIGAKRNALMKQARGQYVVFIDDDDLVAADYVATILAALKNRPDCVGFRVRRFTDGLEFGESINSLACKPLLAHPHKRIDLADGHVIYPRTPNHLNPIRRELARQCPFPEQNFGEDWAFSTAVLPMLSSEVFVDRYLYDYFYRTPSNRAGEKVNAS